MNWVQAVKKDYEREIIAIGGKTVRGHPAYCECVGDGEPAGIRTGEDGRKEQQNHGNTAL
jgi:hypothetical protein